jgi:peptidoglycan hydrolase-like protein with peptidoglycan-binding domain
MADYPTLQQGSSGGDVRNLQVELNTWAQALNRPDFSPGSPDGQFGPQTTEAVRNVQYALGLTADGIVGPQTWDAIQMVGQAMLSGQKVSLKPPQTATGAVPPGSITAPVAPSLGFDLASVIGGMDWKLVGMALAVGIGALYMWKKRGSYV